VYDSIVAYRLTPGEPYATIENLGILAPGASHATGINENGDVTGYALSLEFERCFHPFLWTAPAGPMQDLMAGSDLDIDVDAPPTINNTCQVTATAGGWADCCAWRYTPGVGWEDLGGLWQDPKTGGGISPAEARGINNFGDVVGTSVAEPHRTNPDWRAFLYSDELGMENLGTLAPPKKGKSWDDWSDSAANAVNDNGYVVGGSCLGDSDASPNRAAFIWHRSFGMVNLDNVIDGLPEGCTVGAVEINNSGDICVNFQDEACLLIQYPYEPAAE
jgi:probable HAF family extracellular repeat protein